MKNNYIADLRSLALLRICISVLIIFDLLSRWANLTGLYSNEGALPVWLAKGFNPFLFSFFYLNDSPLFHNLLFILAVISSFLLLIGFKTRIATFTTWLLLLSIHNRNILQNDGGDNIILLTLIWGFFLPWGIKYSIDGMKKTQRITNEFISLSSSGFFTQIGLIYLSTAIYKRSNEWLVEGSGVYYALTIGHFETPFGHFLLNFPVLLLFLNYSVLLLELIAPFALFWPIKNQFYRTIFVFILISLHLGFGAGLTLGTFTFVMPIALLGLLPPLFWDKIIDLKNYLTIKVKNHDQRKKQSPSYPSTKITNALAAILLCYAIFLNILPLVSQNSGLNTFYQLNKVLSLSQDWRFFGPKPYDYGLWFVTVGKLENNQEVDVLTNKSPNFSRPEYISSLYKDTRWRNFLDKLHLYKLPFEPYASFLCGQWNRKSPIKLVSLEIYAITEKNSVATKSKNISKEKITNYLCSGI